MNPRQVINILNFFVGLVLFVPFLMFHSYILATLCVVQMGLSAYNIWWRYHHDKQFAHLLEK